MVWYALEVRSDEKVAGDLTLASVIVYRPVARVEWWDGRRSIVRSRYDALLPGVLLVGSPSLPSGATRQWHRFMQGAVTGSPLRVPDADNFILRCERGDFDVCHEDRRFEVGDQVLVSLLGLVGEVVSAKGRRYRVSFGRHYVSVGQGGLVLA